MTQEMKRNIVKAAPNRWLVFCILTLSGGIAFKLSSMKDMFYVPMQEFMGLTNTQIGGAMSMYGTVQTIGLIAGIYIPLHLPGILGLFGGLRRDGHFG